MGTYTTPGMELANLLSLAALVSGVRIEARSPKVGPDLKQIPRVYIVHVTILLVLRRSRRDTLSTFGRRLSFWNRPPKNEPKTLSCSEAPCDRTPFCGSSCELARGHISPTSPTFGTSGSPPLHFTRRRLCQTSTKSFRFQVHFGKAKREQPFQIISMARHVVK